VGNQLAWSEGKGLHCYCGSAELEVIIYRTWLQKAGNWFYNWLTKAHDGSRGGCVY
jgi:hypothetical protein